MRPKITNEEIRQEAFAETYQDLAPMIRLVATRFKKRYGGDLNELISDAQLIFTELYVSDNHDPDKGMSFSTWVWYKTWKRLIDMRKNGWKKRSKYPTIELPEDEIPEKEPFPLQDWIESLPRDASILAKLVLENPGDDKYREAIQELAERGDDAYNSKGKMIRQWLRITLLENGWRGRRVNKAFKSVRKALV